MIDRPEYLARVSRAVSRAPITALIGPRQAGKTTLARYFFEDQQAVYFDLESQPDLRRLENPEFVLGSLEGLVIIDEIQVLPELFSVLRVLVDRPGNRARYLILGSASPDLVRGVSESLAGRIEFVELTGFSLSEVGAEFRDTLWVRGGFPRSFLAGTDEDSIAWRESFIRTFLERDIPQLGINIPTPAMRRFWTMLAHYHGQTWNASVLARAMGLSDKTVRSYLDILEGTFMVRQLQPWFINIGKRQVKSPKIYLRDSGILHSFLSLPSRHSLLAHPSVGASWEGFALEQVFRALHPNQAYYWATHGGAELDLLYFHEGKQYGVEAKFSEAPRLTRSMTTSLDNLDLSHLWILYPGESTVQVNEKVTVCSLKDLVLLPH